MTILTFNQKVLDEAQAANSELTKKNELLQMQLLEEKQKNKGKGKGKKARKIKADNDTDNTIFFRHFAHSFLFSQNLWTPGKHAYLAIATTQVPPDYNPRNRFKPAPAGKEKLWSQLAFKWELMHTLPPDIRDTANNSITLKQVCQGLNIRVGS
jgi:hypothetical protein